MPEKICKRCGKSFHVKAGEFGSRLYCSMACYRPPTIKQCEQCGKEFRTPPGRSDERRYCSMACYTIAKNGVARGRITEHPVITCEMCGVEFDVYQSRLIQGTPRFCGTECFYKWLKGSERTPRITMTCQACGKRFRVRQYTYDNGGGRFCSRSCTNLGRPSPKIVERVCCICRHCGKTFYKLQCEIDAGRGRFCSRGCNGAYSIRNSYDSKPTSIEQLLLDELDGRGIEYEFQYHVTGWMLDFAFPEHSLAVEADGVYWHNLAHVVEKDIRKNADLQARGWTVLHFDGDQIRQSASACVDQIVEHLTLHTAG